MATIPFTDTLSCTASHGRLALASQIYDETSQQPQAQINRLFLETANSHRLLGTYQRSGLAEADAALPQWAGNKDICVLHYTVGTKSGIILQQVSETTTLQIIGWDNTLKFRVVHFTDATRTTVSAVGGFFPCFVNSMTYGKQSPRQLKVWWNDAGVAECTLPLATTTTDGLLSTTSYKAIFDTTSPTSILSRLAAVEDRLTAKD